MQKLNVIAKISGYFSAVLLHWNCKRIFKCSDMQHTSLTPDAELISLMERFSMSTCMDATNFWKQSGF